MTFQRIIRVKNCEITRRDSNFSQTFPHFHCQHTSAQRKMRSIYSNEPAVFGWFRGHWSLLCKRTHHRFWNLKTKQSINRRAAVEWRSGDSPVVRHDANAHFSTVWCCNLLNTTCNFVKWRADFPFHWAADGPTNHIFPFTANAKIGIYFKHNTALDDGTDLQATEFTARIFFFTQKTDRETSPGRTPVCDWGGTGWPLLLLLAAGRPTQLTQKKQTPVPLVSVAYLTANLSLFCYLSSLRPLFSPPNFFSDSTDGAKWRGGFHLFWPDRASVNQQPDDQCPFLSEMKTDIRRI